MYSKSKVFGGGGGEGNENTVQQPDQLKVPQLAKLTLKWIAGSAQPFRLALLDE